MTIRVLGGHSPDVLAALEPGSVQCAVTSPPYWLLRSYQTDPQVWPDPDGALPCRGGVDLRTGAAIDGHEWGDVERTAGPGKRGDTTVRWNHTGRGQSGHEYRTGAVCTRCHSWKGELGQEPTVERYISNLLHVFRAVRRVLRDDGTLWVNLSTSYLNDAGGQNGGQWHSDNGTAGSTLTSHGRPHRSQPKLDALNRISQKAVEANRQAGRQDRTGRLPEGYWLKRLDLVDVPGLFAHAMQRDGWYWRSDICLTKDAPLPESVQGVRFERCRVKVAASQVLSGYRADRPQETPHHQYDVGTMPNAEWAPCPGCPKCENQDGWVLRRGNGRPTRSWERLLLFAKRPGYFFDSFAVREPNSSPEQLAHNLRYAREYAAHTNGAANRQPGNGNSIGIHSRPGGAGRNARDWLRWKHEPQSADPDGAAHYAAFSTFIPEFAIKAGTSARGCCPCCGAPHARVLAHQRPDLSEFAHRTGTSKNDPSMRRSDGAWAAGLMSGQEWNERASTTTLGWRPTCSRSCPGHARPPTAATVLDPFAGSGTSLLAADRLGRNGIGIDLNPDYTSMSVRRLIADAPLLAQVQTENAAAAAEGSGQLALALEGSA